jgi:hypothetical protein
VHVIIKRVKKDFPSLTWIRTSMAYHRFPNVRELLQGDLNAKLNESIRSLDFEVLSCNCRDKNDQGICKYKSKCRTPIVVYKATCSVTKMAYIGNTQQHPKKRMQQHNQDVRKLVISGIKSDSFANHFCRFVPKPKSATDKIKVQSFVRYDFEILWKGNPLSTVKTFGTRACKLCVQERLQILKAVSAKGKKYSINTCNEIYGACRHKPTFHRYAKQHTASTDESPKKDERVPTNLDSCTSTSSSDSASIYLPSRPRFFQEEDDIYGNPTATCMAVGLDRTDINVAGGVLEIGELAYIGEQAW